MLALCEFAIIAAANWWFPGVQFSASLAAAVTSIVYMRWGAWGAFHAVEAGVVFCYFSGGTKEQFVIYCAGNLFSLLALILLKVKGKETVRTSRNLSLIFPLLVQFLMHCGRAGLGLAFGYSFGDVLQFFTTDSLSYVFTFVIIWIARRLDGVYEDQKHFLIRFQAEEKRNGR